MTNRPSAKKQANTRTNQTIERAFPADLLTQSISAKLSYFDQKMMGHPHLLAADRALTQIIAYPATTSLVFLWGPAGVGKSILLRRIMRRLREEALLTIQENPAHIPFLFAEALPPPSGNFDWREFYLRLLLRANEPLADYKLNPETVPPFAANAQWQVLTSPTATITPTSPSAPSTRAVVSGSNGNNLNGLRRALENWITAREPKVILLDQAQHLSKVSSSRRLLDQMDNLKSLADITETVIVLVGDYHLLGLANLSAQLNRRSHHIHFSRYCYDLPEEVEIFQSCVQTLQGYLPLENEPDLVSQWEYLYERSLGCVGLLKQWLMRTLATYLEAERRGVESVAYQKLLPKSAWSASRLRQMSQELAVGERELAENSNDLERVRYQLGIAALPEISKPVGTKEKPIKPKVEPIGAVNAENTAKQTEETVAVTSQTACQRGVGRRKPVRDPIGKINNQSLPEQTHIAEAASKEQSQSPEGETN